MVAYEEAGPQEGRLQGGRTTGREWKDTKHETAKKLPDECVTVAVSTSCDTKRCEERSQNITIKDTIVAGDYVEQQ